MLDGNSGKSHDVSSLDAMAEEMIRSMHRREHVKETQLREKRLAERKFLAKLRGEFLPKPARIFYPGCAEDTILEGPFAESEIHYLDWSSSFSRRKRNFYKGDYRDIRFEPGYFDAMLHKDNDASLEATVGMLSYVRPGGLVIYYPTPACIFTLNTDQMRAIPKLREMAVPFAHPSFLVFQTALIKR